MASFADRAHETAEADTSESIDTTLRVATLRRERDQLRSRVHALDREVIDLRKVVGILDQIAAEPIEPPKWLTPLRPKAHSATAVVMLSDMHFDEVIRPEQMGGINAYNRDIATMRLEKWAKNVVKLARYYSAGQKWDGVVVMLGGDALSGNIHPELVATNDDTPIGGIVYWSEMLAAALNMIRGEFPRMHIAATWGNHGRDTPKQWAKLGARTNFDWLLAKQIERHFRDDKKVTAQVPEAFETFVPIYGWGHLLTHGNHGVGSSAGQGIAGIWAPIMRMRAKTANRYSAQGQPFSTMWNGHWHQYIPTPSLVINGSLKGADDWGTGMGFMPEPPQQAFAIVTPENNITAHMPVFCADRKAEKW